MLSWLEEITAVTQTLINQNSCSFYWDPKNLSPPTSPQKRNQMGLDIKEKNQD